jgi:hypothetical protein
MPRKALFEFCCDAPGCLAHCTREAKDLIPPSNEETWDSRDVNDVTLYGCCEHHLAAAILQEMGYAAAAKLLVDAATPAAPQPKQ